LTNTGDRLQGRNGEIWRKHLLGWTQEALAEEHGLSQARISQILSDVRATIPEPDLVQARQTHQELLGDLRRRVSEIALAPLPPVTAGKDGLPVQDPVTGDYVRDYSGRYQALMGVAKLEERLAKLMGLDAAEKVDVSVTEAARSSAQAVAADALARLHGGTE
jgi:DNA-binding transcriptional regulator LsrR (DeoR family)